ncbi:MAG: carboxypeptidase-like regulatory domain-containing protein, partial [Gemmatimonadetes bacterium]|nr:carboxypeptidase-like regulatory domain-containing protein [Gemmatimonadota bacterium]NIS00559.1 carboxypeptidase-like regulatory domain-containing protein [Gemmatimonadota bacterium]NIT66224.1 carboxypeptidase-like regulatory domain-containing protein [Gemmatimonadota bacterium]NIU54416.1 hypothetical protein [Gemmatimonadota bacterium]NIV22784.1 hypothetical protein [Gemmatimonadota bacterium]
ILGLATSATPQIVAGRAVDASTGAPIDGVVITLLDTLDATHAVAVSNMAGEFLIVVPAPGTYALRATRLGYATARTRPIGIGEAEVVEVELWLDVQALELEPLTVVVRRRENLRERDLREYHERIELYGRRHIGSTRIFAREDLEGRDAWTVEDALENLSPWWRRFGRACAPRVFLDGRPASGGLLDPFMSLSNIEGIEFYTGFGPTSTRFWDPYGCGVVLVWTRPTLADARPLGLKKLLGAAGAAALVTLLASWLLF